MLSMLGWIAETIPTNNKKKGIAPMAASPASSNESSLPGFFKVQRMNRPEAADYLGLSANSLASFAASGRHSIPFHKVGRKVFYLRNELDAWLAKRGIQPETATH